MEQSPSKNLTYYRKTKEKTNQDVTQREIYKILLLLNDCDTNLQTQIILTLGFVLLKNNTHAEVIIKHDPLYEKLLHYLNKGKQSQIGLVLNFISTLLHIDREEGPTRRKSLYLYAQNMIRISGCLSALRILFMSMMQRDVWSALCRCFADVCRDCTLNQTFCSDLIPMCIQYCRRANTYVIVFLQSLLERHEKNNKLFHLNNGMSIFTRESIYNTQYLQLLNTILENVSSEFVDILKNNVFTELYRMRLVKHSEIAQWVSIILYSYEKGKFRYKLRRDNLTRNETTNCTVNLKDGHESDNTVELLKNVFREVANYNYYERRNENTRNFQIPKAFSNDRKLTKLRKPIDLSFSSLVKQPVTEDSFAPFSVINSSVKTYNASKTCVNFYPISTSTPKQRTQTNRKIAKRAKIPKQVKNLSAKFLDAVNSSCTTIIKSIKSVFTRTKEHTDEVGSFTEYMRIRDQFLGDISQNSREVKCMTCNDTFMLMEKLQSDDCLKVTVKKLKLGINMFGCDFKKISKTFWPHEQCMTPAVLYNLYRKLIVK